jgi:hypothetical protein
MRKTAGCAGSIRKTAPGSDGNHGHGIAMVSSGNVQVTTARLHGMQVHRRIGCPGTAGHRAVTAVSSRGIPMKMSSGSSRLRAYLVILEGPSSALLERELFLQKQLPAPGTNFFPAVRHTRGRWRFSGVRKGISGWQCRVRAPCTPIDTARGKKTRFWREKEL